MDVTQQTEPTVSPTVTIKMHEAVYIGPIRHLKGCPARVLVRSDTPDKVRGKLLAVAASALSYEWTLFPSEQFQIGEQV